MFFTNYIFLVYLLSIKAYKLYVYKIGGPTIYLNRHKSNQPTEKIQRYYLESKKENKNQTSMEKLEDFSNEVEEQDMSEDIYQLAVNESVEHVSSGWTRFFTDPHYMFFTTLIVEIALLFYWLAFHVYEIHRKKRIRRLRIEPIKELPEDEKYKTLRIDIFSNLA